MRVPVARPVRHVFRWDLDKTYLRTEFDGIRDLARAAFERARDKRAVPGAPALMKALRDAGGPAHRICIVSGSPRQMRKVLEAKLALDGVAYDEFVLKPNLKNLFRGRFRALRQQIPYKLPALLESRIALGGQAPETLFGDDAESDAAVYSLYADILAGRVSRGEVEAVLDATGAYPDERKHTLALVDSVPRGDVVGRIVIHLDRRSPTAGFDLYGPRLVPVYNFFQAALVLHADGWLTATDVVRVGHEMIAEGDHELATLANSLQDLVRRGRFSRDVARRLAIDSLSVAEAMRADWPELPPREQIAWAFATRLRELGSVVGAAPKAGGRIDYVAMVAQERRHRSRRG